MKSIDYEIAKHKQYARDAFDRAAFAATAKQASKHRSVGAFHQAAVFIAKVGGTPNVRFTETSDD